MEEIKVGDKVRSFDFPFGDFGRSLEGEDACYVEGVVEGVGEVIEGCPRYNIRVTRRVWGGIGEWVHGDYVFPPVNGTPRMLGGVCDGVERISE